MNKRLLAFLLTAVTIVGSVPGVPVMAAPDLDAVIEDADESIEINPEDEYVPVNSIEVSGNIVALDGDNVYLTADKNGQDIWFRAVNTEGKTPTEKEITNVRDSYEGEGDKIIMPDPKVVVDDYYKAVIPGTIIGMHTVTVTAKGGESVGSGTEKHFNIYINAAPAKVSIKNGADGSRRAHIEDENNYTGTVRYFISPNRMTKAELAGINIESMYPVDEGNDIDEIFDEDSSFKYGENIYFYTVPETDNLNYAADEFDTLKVDPYIGASGFAISGENVKADAATIKINRSHEDTVAFVKVVADNGEDACIPGLSEETTGKYTTLGSRSENKAQELIFAAGAELGSYPLTLTSIAKQTDRSKGQLKKDYTLSVNAAAAASASVNKDRELVIVDEINKDDVIYLLSGNSALTRTDINKNYRNMVTVSSGDLIDDLVADHDFFDYDDTLYLYTVNVDTDGTDDIDDTAWYMADEVVTVETEFNRDASEVYQVTDSNSAIVTPYANHLFEVAVIKGVEKDGNYETASANEVSSNEAGEIAIDPEWLGKDLVIEAKGNLEGADLTIDSNPIYLPVVKFVDGALENRLNAPKIGDEIEVGMGAANIEGVSENAVWFKTPLSGNGAMTEVEPGEKFEKGIRYNAVFTFSTASNKSLIEDDLELVQFVSTYETTPEIPCAFSISEPEKIQAPIVRSEERDAGKDNYTGVRVEADFSEASDYIEISKLTIDNWADINWTENTGVANRQVFTGEVLPKNADEKVLINLVDTVVNGTVIASVSDDTLQHAEPDDVVAANADCEVDEDGKLTITINGSETMNTAGFATLRLDTEKGLTESKGVYSDVLVKVNYADITGVSVNNIIKTMPDGAVLSTMEVSGLVAGAKYAANYSVSGINAEPRNKVFTADENGKIADTRLKNVSLSINRTSDKEIFYNTNKTANAAWECYSKLTGKAADFTSEETKAETSTGLFYEIENKDNIVYTGSKITPVVHVYDGDTELVEGQHFTVSYKNNLNAGDAKAVVKGKNGSGVEKTELTFKIRQADIADATIATVQSVKGRAGRQPVVFYNGIKMAQKKTFVKIAKNQLKNSSTEEMIPVKIEGTVNFTGTSTFYVRGVSSKIKISVELSNKKFAYAGHYNFNSKDVINAVTFKKGNADSAKILLPTDDANFEMGNAGSYKLAVVGTGEFEGAVAFLKFNIMPVKNADFRLNVNEAVYDPCGVTFDESQYDLIGVADETLIKGLDYTMSYSKNKKVGTAKVTVTFKGSYKGTKKASATFKINKADIATAIDEAFAAPVVNEKKAKKNTVYLVQNNTLLKKGNHADYTTTYNEISDGVATIIAYGAGNYNGSVEVKFAVKDGVPDFTKAQVKAGKNQKFNYNGSPFTNEANGANKVNVEVAKVSAESMQYHFFNNVNKGKATVVVCGDGVNSTGSKSAKFSIKGSKTINDTD